MGNGAVVVPLMWGPLRNHHNALHTRPTHEQVMFIFIDLDTRLDDFKFWTPHELARVFTLELAGSAADADFTDAFAGVLCL